MEEMPDKPQDTPAPEVSSADSAKNPPEPPRRPNIFRRFFAAIGGAVLFTWRSLKWLFIAVFWGLVAAAIVLVIGNVVFATKRNEAHRNLHPEHADCANADGWTILAEEQNDELRIVRADPSWRRKFRCAIQTHLVPRSGAPNRAALPPLKYHLAFLEFREDGGPQPIEGRPDGSTALSQYALLQEHLRSPERKSNFVLVFVHGWRNDARLGNDNVADLRHYAAHAARYLDNRCADEGRFCGTEVTAIYVGWRGARVDEVLIKETLGHRFGNLLAGATMWITLFDRKPISEEIGPSAITALRGLDRILDSKNPDRVAKGDPSLPMPGTTSNDQRMIVIGHSLGGNMLITALKDQLIKSVVRHEAGGPFAAPVGDLVVLLNPASEAAHWTALQRAVWHRIAFRTAEENKDDSVFQGHKFFRADQPPVLMSITAARSWPPSEIWPQDCEWLRLPTQNRTEAAAKAKMLPLIASSRGVYASDVNYDWATFDLFPLFKLDPRPFAATVQRVADRIGARERIEAGACPAPGTDNSSAASSYFWSAVSKPVALLASFLRNAPFINTDREQTHTIGHFNPPRPSTDTLVQRVTLPIKPFGTTHELVGDRDRNSEQPVYYRDIGTDRDAACPSSPYWLWRARKVKTNGTYWDSNELEPLPDGRKGKPAAHIVHSFVNAGMAAITRANDPFWNVRAFDNALSEHGGYMLSSFICVINQFVMDDVASPPPAAN